MLVKVGCDVRLLTQYGDQISGTDVSKALIQRALQLAHLMAGRFRYFLSTMSFLLHNFWIRIGNLYAAVGRKDSWDTDQSLEHEVADARGRVDQLFEPLRSQGGCVVV